MQWAEKPLQLIHSAHIRHYFCPSTRSVIQVVQLFMYEVLQISIAAMDATFHDMPCIGIFMSSKHTRQTTRSICYSFSTLQGLTPTLSRRPRTVRAADCVDFSDPPKVTPQVGEHGETGKGSLCDGFARLRFELDFGSERFDSDPDPFKFCK
jgi:hypothetical protein